MFRELASLSAIVGAVLACGDADAQAISTPLSFTSSESVQNNSGIESGDGPYQVTNGVATAGTTYTLGSGGESLSINPGSTQIQKAQATESWEFFLYPIVPLTPAVLSTPVPIVLTGLGTLYTEQANPNVVFDFATASVYSTAVGLGPIFPTITGVGPVTQEIFGISLVGYALPNTVYSVTETVTGESIPEEANVTTGTVRASIDPAISFQNSSDAADFALAFSPVPSVPEPSTWVMTLVGLGSIAVLLRNRLAAV